MTDGNTSATFLRVVRSSIAGSVGHRVFSSTAAALTAMAVLTLTLTMVSAAPALAQDPFDCDQAVVDTSGELNVDTINESILNSAPPDVRFVIRGFDRAPGGDLVDAVNEIVAQCFSDGGEGLDDSTVMISLSIEDRQSDLWIGDRWLADVGDADAIRENTIGDRARDGEYTEAMTDAIVEISSRIDAATGSGAEDGELVSGTEGEGAVDDGQVAPEPDGDGISLLPVVGGLSVLGAGAGVFVAVNRRRKLTEARQRLQSSMAGPQIRVGVLRERDDRVSAQADVWEKLTSGRTSESLSDLLRQTASARTETERAAALLNQSLPGGVGSADRTALEAARQRVVELSRALDLNDEALDRLVAFGAHLDHLRVAVPGKRELLLEEIEGAKSLAGQRASQGWAVAGQVNELEKMQTELSALEFASLEQDWLAHSDNVEGNEAKLFATSHYLQALPSRVESLKKWNQELESAAELELARSEDVRRRFTSLASLHAADSWRWAADFAEQAVDEIEQARKIRAVTMTETLSRQRFDDAGRELEQAGLHIITADHYLDQMEDLMVDLEHAREEAPGIMAQGREILSELATFIAANDEDLDDSFNREPAEFAGALDGLEMELRQVKPNYLRVADTGNALNRQMDEVMTKAEDEKAMMQALRREAQREVSRAQRAVARARKALGWELFQSGMGDALERLEEQLQRLPEHPGERADAAADIADEALAIQERIIARRRRGGTWVVVGGGGFGHTTTGGFGGGGRSIGGGGFSGGGHSFGGGGFSGGGHSFGGGRSSGGF